MLKKLVPLQYFYIIILSFILSIIGLITHALSSEEKKNISYIERPDVKEFINQLHIDTNIPQSKIVSILKKANKSEKSLQLMSRPAESKMPWSKYKKIFITENRINQGVDFWKKNQLILEQIEQKHGVPAAIIVSILGVETYYGKYSGDFKVLDVLTTLSFDFPRRKLFFQNELKHFLIFTYEQKLDPEKIQGSYAGAMGMPQFMPSNYRSYATCTAKSRKPDIWNQDHDSIESIANYMQKHGWKKNQLIALQVVASGTACETIISKQCKCEHSIKQLKQVGWYIKEKISDSNKVMAMKHQGINGNEFWIGFHNFEVITKYNKSQLYALAVHQLAEAVHNKRKATQSVTF